MASSITATGALLRLPPNGSVSPWHKPFLSRPLPLQLKASRARGLERRQRRVDAPSAELQSSSNVETATPGAPSHGSATDKGTATESVAPALAGEDAGVFALEDQKASSWGYFFAVLVTVMTALYFLWLDPSIGVGGKFVDGLEGTFGNSEVTMLAILVVFAIAHSGLAAFRAKGEELIGARSYRVLFGVVSLPLAVAAVAYFINHRYDGVQLWQVRTVPGVHEVVWLLSFVSFFFLYPSTFNLLEVAAVDKPKVHMWETGIMRITRHPQMVGQLIWCLAHVLWIGNTFMITTSLGLCAHHAFGVWHGDQRLKAKYGDAFEAVKARTSLVPFQAIWEGRQKLPDDYYEEFLRAPYFAIVVFTLGAYFAHPLMQQASFWLHW